MQTTLGQTLPLHPLLVAQETFLPVEIGFQMATIANGTGILSFTGSPAATNKTQAIINFSQGCCRIQKDNLLQVQDGI